MRILALAIACPVFASLAFAQLDPYTLTVTASRSIAVQPDQAVLSITVDADPSLGLNDILALVQGVGLTQSNLSSSYTTLLNTNVQPYTQFSVFAWTFSQTIPYSSLKNTLTNLGALQAKLAKQNSGPMLTFSVNGVQVSPQLQAAQSCPTAALVSDATAQAQALAQAAGFGVGQISTITDGSAGVVGSVAPASVGTVAYIAGQVGLAGVVNISTFALFQPVYSSTASVPCTIVVKFKLTPQ